MYRVFNNWDCLVLTCPTVSSVVSTETEINILKKKGRIPESLCVLTVEDPAKNIGSGAATLNALLIATEHLSVKQNYMVVSSDVLNEARILILHNGRNYIYSCTGKAFINLPLEYSPEDASHKAYSSGIISNLESALIFVDKISKNCPYGVWVCSTDMMIFKGKESIAVDWLNIADVVMFCIPCDVKYATGHGVVAVDEQGLISDILYCGPEKQIRNLVHEDGKVPLVSGIVYLTVSVAESLLSLHVQAPLDSCTYLGLDSGADPIQVSLFFDLLVAMSSHISKESFIAGKCGKTYNLKVGIDQSGSKESILARSLVWEELSRFRMSPKILTGCQHLYWSAEGCAKNHMDNLICIACSENVHSVCEINSDHNPSQHLIVNSCIKASKHFEVSSKSIIYDSELDVQSLHVGENSLICGISMLNGLFDVYIPSNLVIIRANVKDPDEKIFTIMFGVNEDLAGVVNTRNGTFCNKSWSKHFEYLNISEKDLWCSNLKPKQKTLMNARLFIPNMSLIHTLEMFHNDNENSILTFQKMFEASKRYCLNDILNSIDYSKIFDSRRAIYSRVSCEIIRRVLENNENIPLIPYFYAASAEGWHLTVMDVLDEILLSDANSIIKTRTLSNMADLLGAMAGSRGGLRSGPGSNPSWSAGFSLLMKGDIMKGLEALKRERSNWLDRPDHIIRAARHYERATQILIQRSVSTVKESIVLSSQELPEVGACIVAECPARIDLQGGWTDTPPICYELGGSVVNIAILVDGKKPIGAKAWRTTEPSIVLKLGLGDMCQEIVVKHMKDILNYDQPNAQGALLKAALICANVIDIHSNLSLSEQLMKRFRGGFVIQSWSLLPQGCGMGTSSILAGAIVGVLWSVSGKVFDKLTVVHSVLYVEQLLTTGGGWQDQVSGIMGGINRGYSEPSLPLSVKVEAISLTPDIIEKLNAHLLLIYTGKVRLAKNLLQNVIRNWYAREETVVTCFKDLLLHSHQMKNALMKGNFQDVGHLMDRYWEQKKVLAPGCEPLVVKNMMEVLKPLCHGQILVGAGGGGFMCILTKEPNVKEHVKAVLSNIIGNQKMSLHTVTVDSSGLEIRI